VSLFALSAKSNINDSLRELCVSAVKAISAGALPWGGSRRFCIRGCPGSL